MIIDQLTPALDADLRKYAKRLDPDNGEDAYHKALITLMEKPMIEMETPLPFFKRCIKWALSKFYAAQSATDKQVENYIKGGMPIGMEGLRVGQARGVNKRTHCRKGHPLEEGNIKYVGGDKHRTCRICRNASNLASYKRMKALTQPACSTH